MKIFLLLVGGFAATIGAMSSPALAQPAQPGTAAATRAPASPARPAAASAVPGASPTRVVAATLPDGAPPQGEPNVKRTVIEDNGSRIEELKVRGQTRRITVTPKVGSKLQYEVLPEDSGGLRDSAASQTPHGNEGRRVWNVLSF